MKESYERTELEITEFRQKDVIVTSGEDPVNPVINAPRDRYMAPIR